jgi:hypothetical protein
VPLSPDPMCKAPCNALPPLKRADQLLDSLEVPASLSKAYGFWSSLPQLPILIGHCIFCTTFAPETRGNFVLHYW